MILAQGLPSITTGEFAVFMCCMMLMLYAAQAATGIYRNLWPAQPKREGEQFVTHDQFDGFKTDMNIFKAEISNKFDKITTYMEAKLTGFDSDFNERLQRLDDYMHEASHRTNNSLQAQVAAIAELRGIMLGKVTPIKQLPEGAPQ